jgi:cell fate (sporulation/competence/biofilm development) regulator YlbF (YheA/YmcA/DUF963 family)
MNYDAAKGAWVAVSTIDLLEECLETIHRARKMSLNARSERAQALLDRRRSKLASQSKSVASRISASIERDRRNRNHKPEEVDDYYYDEEEIAAGVPAKRAVSPIAPSSSSSSAASHTTNPAPSAVNSDANNVNNNQKAEKLFEDFEKELRVWWTNAGNTAGKREDEEVKGEFADYLTDKYMCQRLDALPPSKEITAIRKKMYKMIEDFATDPKFTIKEVASEPTTSHSHKHQPSNSSRKPAAAKAESSSPDNNAKHARTPAQHALERANAQATSKQQASLQAAADALETPQLTAKEEKQLAEKNKIQDQYQQYMKMKQATAEADRESQMKQYENLNDDIRGLLSSIQHNKSVS